MMGSESGTAASVLALAGVSEALVAAAPDALVAVDASGVIVLANPAVEKLFGYPPAELVGQRVEVLVPEGLSAAHAAHRDEYIAHPRTRPMGAGLRLVGRRRDGSEIAIDVGLAPVASGEGRLFVAFVRDATEQRRAEARLEAASEVSQAVLGGAAAERLWTMTARHARRLAGARWAAAIVAMPDASGHTVLVAGDGAGMEALVGRAYPTAGAWAEDVVNGKASVLSADLVDHPGATAMARELGVGPAVAVAVRGTARQFGTMIVGRAGGEPPFTSTDVAVLESYVSSTAVALTLGDARADLERLSMAEEHDRIARDMHDTVIQRLFAIGMGLAGVQRLTAEPVAGRIGQSVEELDDTIREIRSTIFELQRPAAGAGGLRRQVQALAADAAPRLGFTPRVAFDGPVDTMAPAAVTNNLLPVVREALSNIVRHSQAQAVDLVISLDGDDLLLAVSDDGIGPPEGPRAGSGLRNMASRAERLGGTFTLVPRTPRGTRLEWRVPVR
jgi:PAS domain S-box-containing protein